MEVALFCGGNGMRMRTAEDEVILKPLHRARNRQVRQRRVPRLRAHNRPHQVSGPYAPPREQGFRWDDPAFGIVWPQTVSAISEKDADWPLLELGGSSC